VLISVDEDRIVGAVGPLSVMTDPAGRFFDRTGRAPHSQSVGPQ
jgi:hypothetical protein